MMKTNKKEERIGEINISNQGYLMKIIEYNKYTDISVEFQDDNKAIVHTQYSSFKKRVVNNPFHKTICNVGYIGNTQVGDGQGKHKYSYKFWYSMINRCYNKKYQENRPTYVNCYVCDEWLCYANFEKWFNENYYEIPNKKMCLDKDILHKGNKCYSPENCCFVPNEINVLFTKGEQNRGALPIGVSITNKNKYMARCGIYGKNKTIGVFDSPKEAFLAYKKYKESYIKKVADKYKTYIPDKLYKSMYNYKVKISD